MAALLMLPGVGKIGESDGSSCNEDTPDCAEDVRECRGDFGGGGGGVSSWPMSMERFGPGRRVSRALGGTSASLLTGIDRPRPLGDKGWESDCLLVHTVLCAGRTWLSRMYSPGALLDRACESSDILETILYRTGTVGESSGDSGTVDI